MRRFIPYTKRRNTTYMHSWCRPCICGSSKVNINNNSGWSEKSITCKKCRRTLTAPTIEEVIKLWNKEYLAKFPEGFINE